MSEFIQKLKEKIFNGENITKIEALKLANEPNLAEILDATNEIRKKFCGEKFNFCSIINAKSGKCSENCKYCAQSAHFDTNCEVHGILPSEVVLNDAKNCEISGIHRYSLVASGRGLKGKSADMKKVAEIYEILAQNTKIHLCASFGIADFEALSKLKQSGVKTYHHNLETSRRFFSQICTTHSYDERVETIKNAKLAGLDICSGGLFGLGESFEDRIDMAFELRNLGVTSVPINILTPIKGTPLQNATPLSEDEILRIIAVFRFIMPSVFLRFAGGRNNLKNSVKTALNSGINSAITGNFLTTCGDNVENDKILVKSCGFDYKKGENV